MRILLVNPFYPISETPSPPLGLAYVAGALEAAGHRVRIFDCVVEPYSHRELARKMAAPRPRMVGVTAVTMNVDRAMAVLADVKTLEPATVTVAGGPHVSFTAVESLSAYPALDVVVVGEGEDTVTELAAAVAEKRSLDRVRGIVYRRSGGEIHRTAPRPPISSLDTLAAPARHLIPLGRYRALNLPVSMTTSRGCPHRCVFCAGRKMVGPRVRYRDPASVVDEMAALARLGFGQINIADDLFTAKPAHCLTVCDEILERGLTFRWTAFARVDTVSLEVLQRMKAAGCTGVAFGVETGSPAILKTVRKGIELSQVVAAVDMCNAAGITPFASFILGLPGETPETLEQTLAFAGRLEAAGVAYGFHLLAPFPGTDIGDHPDQYGIRILTEDWSAYHANRAIVETETVTAGMLDDIVMGWERRYDAFLGDIARRMEKGTISLEDAQPLISLERTVTLYDLMMGRVVEEQGAWTTAGALPSPDRALDRLSQRAAAALDKPAAKVRTALVWAVETGHLLCRNRADGRVHWRWQNRLPPPVA